MVAGQKRTAALEALAKEELILAGQEEKLAALTQRRVQAEENARIAAESKARADKALEEASIRRAVSTFGIGPGGSLGWGMGGTSPYAASRSSSALTTLQNIAKNAGPSSSLADRPTTPTGPAVAISAAKDQAKSGMRGMGAMNAMFALSMVTSSVSMLGGASADAAAKMGMFTTALMTATMLMNTGISGKGIATNFLGLGSLSNKVAAKTVPAPFAPNAAGAAAARGAGFSSAGLSASRVLSLLGGPVGIAAGIGVTAAITGFMMYRNAAEEARERAIAAFNDPVKSAEYFGETIMNVSDIIENNRLSNVSEDLQGIDRALRDAVKEDYRPLIEQVKYLSAGAGAQSLAVA